MFEFQQRSFKGNGFRPLPEVLIDENLQFFSVATAWGPSSETQKLLGFLRQNYQSLSSDKEQTNVYKSIESLSEEENALRALMLSGNDWVFNKQNFGSCFKFAYELFSAVFHKGILTFSQVGQPFGYLDREGIDLQLLGSVLDFSALYSEKGKRLSSMPSQLIGLKSDVSVSVFSIPVQRKDRFILLCRDFAPVSFLQTDRSQRNLEDMPSLLNSYDKTAPFWLGQLFLA